MALAWGDTGGAVPWNISLGGSHWVTPQDNSKIWIDYRSNVMVANSASDATGWTAERAHAPNLAYVPYLMTAERWYLDRLNAQAAWALSSMNPDSTYGRCVAASCDIELTEGGQQVRGMAWSLREIGEAGFLGNGYFASVTGHNWAYAQQVTPALATSEGQTAIWWPRIWDPNGLMQPWEEDFLTGIAALFAGQGDMGAKAYVTSQHPWLTGRYAASAGWNQWDSCTYTLLGFDLSKNPPVPFQTWSGIESASVAAALVPGTATWQYPQGYYCAIGKGTLGAALSVSPGDAALTAGLNWLKQNGPYSTSTTYAQSDPTWNVIP